MGKTIAMLTPRLRDALRRLWKRGPVPDGNSVADLQAGGLVVPGTTTLTEAGQLEARRRQAARPQG